MATNQSNNTSCVKYGHLWISTTADNFQRCERSGCNAVQRFVNGKWVDIANSKNKRVPSAKQSYSCDSLF